MAPIGVVLATLVLTQLARAAPRSVQSVVSVDDRCNEFYGVSNVFENCYIGPLPENVEVDFINVTTTTMCRTEASIRNCVYLELESCPNWNNILSLMNTSFQFCVNGEVPSEYRSFLEGHAGVVITNECIYAVMFELVGCSNTGRPSYPQQQSLDNIARYHDSMYKWYIGCFSNMNLNRTGVVQGCNKTRQDVYNIMVATLEVVVPFGINHYPKFESYVLNQ